MGEEEEEQVKLEWMYKEETASKVDPEEYLLGKAIDKHFEAQINEGDKVILPKSIFANKNSNIAVDTERKMKQDPLVQIRLKEIEMKRQLLKNPVKLKKLQTLLKAHEEKLATEQKLKKRKKKEDIDDILAEKYLKLTKKLGAKSLSEFKDKKKKKRKDSGSEDEKRKRKKKSKRCSSSDSESEERKSRPSVSRKDDRYRNKDRDSIRKHEVEKKYSDSEEEPVPKSYGLILPAGAEPRKVLDKSDKPKQVEKFDKKVKHKPKKLSQREKEAKLKEMLKDGKVRDKERKHNLNKYRAEQKSEQKGREYDHDFLRKQMLLATTDSTVEQRIKSNINNLQKSVGFMDKV